MDQVGDMLKPSVDATAWQMEVERVLPHLKVTIRSDHRVRRRKGEGARGGGEGECEGVQACEDTYEGEGGV